MEKIEAVASLGQAELLRPARVRAALAANDRLKLYLSVLQAAHDCAQRGDARALDLAREFAVAGVDAPWLAQLPATAYREGKELHVAGLDRLAGLLAEDLCTMARPLEGDADFAARCAHWCAWLEALAPDTLSSAQLHALTSGKRGKDDSLHLLVMDLHKALNRLAGALQRDHRRRPRLAGRMRPIARASPPSCAGSTPPVRSSSSTRGWTPPPPATVRACCCRTTSAPTTPTCW
jgi:hypothetical protein